MAQIIKYWSHQPIQYSNYNFSSMANNPNSSTNNTDLARLMKDCGTSVSMSYGCSSSGAYTNIIPEKLQNHFNYANGGTREAFDYDDYDLVKHNIDQAKPLLFDACTGKTKFLWWTWGTGSCHAWVVDGYKMNRNGDCYTSFWFHMNWGWDGYENDWYYQSNWNPGGMDLNYVPYFTYNIKP